MNEDHIKKVMDQYCKDKSSNIKTILSIPGLLSGDEISKLIKETYESVDEFKKVVDKTMAENITKPISRYFKSKPAAVVIITREKL